MGRISHEKILPMNRVLSRPGAASAYGGDMVRTLIPTTWMSDPLPGPGSDPTSVGPHLATVGPSDLADS